MKRLIFSVLVIFLCFSTFAQSNGDPNKYGTTHGNSACKFFDGFSNNGDGTVTDPRNGLVWKRCADGMEWRKMSCHGKAQTLDWFTAMVTAKNSRFLNKDDWRLPSADEWASVTGSWDACKSNISDMGQYAISKTLQNDTKNVWYWSFTRSVGDVEERIVAYAFSGFESSISPRDDRLKLRLVRSSLAPETLDAFNQAYDGIAKYKSIEKNSAAAANAAKEASAYEGSPAGRAERQARQTQQLCRAQIATCIASCPVNRYSDGAVMGPEYSCRNRCESVSCN